MENSNFTKEMILESVNAIIDRYNVNLSDKPDVLQEIWLYVDYSYHKKYVEQGKILAWIRKIAVNKCLDY